MVELHVVHDHQLGEVMNELRTFVEEGRVVFIAFDNEMLRVAQAGALAEIRGNAADQVSGGFSSGFKYPSQQRRGGGFAMRAGDDEIMASTEEKLLQRFGKGKIKELAVENRFHGGVAARHGIADDDEVRGGDILRTEPRCDFHALGFQECGHRGVDVFVLSGDLKSAIAHGGGDGAHRRAADAEEVDVLWASGHRDSSALLLIP